MGKINLDTPLTDITFYKHNTRIHNILCGFMHLKTVRELIRCEKSALRKQRNMGKSAMNVIYDTLEKYGLTLEMCLADIAIYENKPIADEVKIEGEIMKELEERQKAGRTFSDALEDLRPYVSDEMRCEIYRFAVNLLLERVKREGNYPCYKDIECAVTRAAEVYEVVNKKLGKLKI